MSASGDDLDVSLSSLVGEGGTPAGVGAGSAVVVALAARLIGAAARASDDWDGAAGACAQADALDRRGLRLARQNAEALRAARAALSKASGEQARDEQRLADSQLHDALVLSADLPLAIAEAAVDAAELGALAAGRGAAEVRADAAGAAALAAGAAAAAGHLVEINLLTKTGHPRVDRARELAALARAASERALAASE